MVFFYIQTIESMDKQEKQQVQPLSKSESEKLKIVGEYTLTQLKDILFQKQVTHKNDIDVNIWEKWHLKFWLVSDTHFWNKMSAVDELWEFYDRAKDKWVEAFLHAGDTCDGDSVYFGQVYEQDKIWFDAQLEDIITRYPNVWKPTYFLQGNHEESFLKKTWWDIGKAISSVRRDLINLWFYDARIKLNGVDINLHHWGGSMSYAKSYKIQKLLENINPKDQPNVFAAWHWHTALYMFYRKIHSFLPWAFLKENLLAKRFNLDNTIGGRIVEVDIDEKWGSSINTEFIKL